MVHFKERTTSLWMGRLENLLSSWPKFKRYTQISTATSVKPIPVVFDLLPNKEKKTYKRLFSWIVQVIPEWNPHRINVDFSSHFSVERSIPSHRRKRLLLSYDEMPVEESTRWSCYWIQRKRRGKTKHSYVCSSGLFANLESYGRVSCHPRRKPS